MNDRIEEVHASRPVDLREGPIEEVRLKRPFNPLGRHENVNSISNGINIGSHYTDDQLAFLRAIDEYKRVQFRPFPTWSEVLAVLVSLGYRRVADHAALPTFAGLADSGEIA